jgi:F0F1-type ATP synthase membrane subunit b/b'
MVILKNLLFTPVLKMLDSRREKIQAAAKKKEDIGKLVAEKLGIKSR